MRAVGAGAAGRGVWLFLCLRYNRPPRLHPVGQERGRGTVTAHRDPWGRRPGRAQDGAGLGQADGKFRKCTCVPTRQAPAACPEVHVRDLPGRVGSRTVYPRNAAGGSPVT